MTMPETPPEEPKNVAFSVVANTALGCAVGAALATGLEYAFNRQVNFRDERVRQTLISAITFGGVFSGIGGFISARLHNNWAERVKKTENAQETKDAGPVRG